MEYTFSWGSFVFGIIILIISACVVIWHRQLADTFSGGVGSYERYQLWGIIGCVLGLLVMTNLHTLILTAFLVLFFRGI